MKIKPIVYENLTARERIIASIEAEAREDEDERQRLIKSCPKHNYRTNDAAYAEVMENLFYVATGTENEIRGYAVSYLAMLIAAERPEFQHYDVLDAYLQNIADLRAAWNATLKEMGVNPESMTKACAFQPTLIGFVDDMLPAPDPARVRMVAEAMKKSIQAI